MVTSLGIETEKHLRKEASSSFLKKRTKKLLSVGLRARNDDTH
jgi:hypothetical protein